MKQFFGKSLLNKLLALITLMFLFSCSLNQIDRTAGSSKDIFREESLLRYNSASIKQLTNSSDPKLAALALCHQDQVDQGLAKLKESYHKLKLSSDYWNKIGTCYYIDKQFSKASFYFQHALSLTKKNAIKAFSLNNLGVVLLRQRHYDQSFEMFSKAMKFNPRLLTPRFNLAQLHIQFGQIQEAKKILSKLYEMNNQDIDVIASWAAVLLIDQKYSEAIELYQQIDEENISRSDIAGFYALALYKNGEYKKAKEILEEQQVSTEEAFYKLNRRLSSKIKSAIKSQEDGIAVDPEEI